MNRFVALGLSLLYGSAYFLPLLGPFKRYLLPSTADDLVVPTLVADALVMSTMLLIDRTLATRTASRRRKLLAWAGCTVFILIAFNSTLEAADYTVDSL